MVLKKKSIITYLFIFIVMSLINASSVFADKSKNVFLVLDTSLSMVGHGGKNILPKVKLSIEDYIDNKLEDGDKVTFVTFDSDVRIWPTFLVDDKNDRDIVKKFLSQIEAKGRWTHTYKMIHKVLEKAKDLEQLDKDKRDTVIVVMTDGLDDPPPRQRKNRFSIKDILDKYAGTSDRWIYFLSFTELKKKVSDLEKELGKGGKTKFIDASKDPAHSISKIDKLNKKKKRNIVIPLLIALGVLLIIIILAVIFKSIAALKVVGKVEFWNHTILDPYSKTFDFTKHKLREIMTGHTSDCLFHIEDIDVNSSFFFIAVKDKEEDKIKVSLRFGEGDGVVFKNKEASHYIEDGDVFKIGNYSFKFFGN